MSDVVISVENLSKCYRLGTIGTRTLSGDFERWWAQVRGKPDPFLKIGQQDHGNRRGEIIWALRDVSFQVRQGEVLGIIGRNGAGKSTLLKILSRVTAPTSGVVKVKGRVASLLEVGTGFHPELTGRENIYLNGAILGMKKAETDRKFDEIVEFAGVEQFIDTPVKRYSSGMYVRLAFAVAAHLEPEILLVDEVLAVGDAQFQKKCLGKMGEVASEGRTVLFVSHNMGVVSTLCGRTVLLQSGLLQSSGPTEAVIREYLGSSAHTHALALDLRGDRVGTGEVRFARCDPGKQPRGEVIREYFTGDSLYLRVRLVSNRPVDVWVSVSIRDLLERKVMVTDTAMHGMPRLHISGSKEFILFIPHVLLLEGHYRVDLGAYKAGTTAPCDYILDASAFEVLATDLYRVGRTIGAYQGVVHLPNVWLDEACEPLGVSEHAVCAAHLAHR